ncbi:MAG: 50S ribosomal protein L30 [Deltaproteobacteria bacterium]|nr:50S ribosomal protein L30 [Deltaproteobacteria bacterium]
MSVKTEKHLQVTLVRSSIGTNERKRATLKGLGLTRINKTVKLKNTPAIRGMVNHVIQMVKYEFVR